NVTLPDVLSLNISIDGLPLHKSGPATFWPILINIYEMPQVAPMVVAIFCGVSKPPRLEDYLRPLITELNELSDESIVINNIHHMVKVRAVIADAPARAFIKGVAYFNGVHGCLKCTCEGVFSAEARTVIF
uniref:Uncharacterized protein n=1 Tax=Anopheles minimus TaxID=112268 RepID=A0A182WHN2_9DIPT